MSMGAREDVVAEGTTDDANGAAGAEAAAEESAATGVESAGDETDGKAEADDAPSPAGRCEASARSLQDELSDAQRAAEESRDRALRAKAELENARRRFERDLEKAHKFALERFVSDLLPVKDSLELGLAASAEETAGATGIVEGVELTLRMFEQVMDRFGVTTIDPAGEPFNPEFHQAMTMQESDDAESGTVLTVIQKGYLLNERLVRPAMVVVAK